MAYIIYDRDEMFGRWAASRIDNIKSVEKFGQFRALGVATGNTTEDRLMAVVIFHDYQQDYETCQLSFAAVDPRWASKQTVRALLSVPFLQYKCHKVWAAIPHTSERVLGLAKVLGFKREATLADHFGRGSHAVICRMYERTYNKIYWKPEQVKAA